MKVWITKYALTNGIQEVEASPNYCSPGMIAYTTKGFQQYAHGEGREWHRAREGAVARAEEMKAAKIKSLQKSISKLEKLRFA